MATTFETLRSGDEEAVHDLWRSSFGSTGAFDPETPFPAPERIHAAYLDGTLAAIVIVLGFEMTWRGSAIPCGGVSGVGVRPDARGRGLARRLLADTLEAMGARGESISALFPTTASLYRGVGFEVAGWFERRTVPVDALPRGAGAPLAWREVALDDPAVLAVHDAMAARTDGWYRPDPQWWAARVHRARAETGTNRWAYVGARAGADVALVQYRQQPGSAFFDIDAELVAGTDAEALRAALGFLGGHGTTAGKVQLALPGPILAQQLDHPQRAEVSMSWPWMLRVVDPATAVAARPVRAAVTGGVALALHDPIRGIDAQSVVLEVADGRAELTPGGPGDVALDVRDLAVVFAGGDPNVLAEAGRLPGASPADLDLLAAAYASQPSIPVFF